MSEIEKVGTREVLKAFGDKSKKIFRLNFVGKDLEKLIIIETDIASNMQIDVSGLFDTNACFKTQIDFIYESSTSSGDGINYTLNKIVGAYIYLNASGKFNIILEGAQAFKTIEVCVKELAHSEYTNNYKFALILNIINFNLESAPEKIFYVGNISNSLFDEKVSDKDFSSIASESTKFAILNKDNTYDSYVYDKKFSSVYESNIAHTFPNNVKLNFLSPDESETYGTVSFKAPGEYNCTLNVRKEVDQKIILSSIPVAAPDVLGGIYTGYVLSGTKYPVCVTGTGVAYVELSGFSGSTQGLEYKGAIDPEENTSISVLPDTIDTNNVIITLYSDLSKEKYKVNSSICQAIPYAGNLYFKGSTDGSFREWTNSSVNPQIIYTAGTTAVVGDNIYKSKDTTITPISTIVQFYWGSETDKLGYFYNFAYDGWYLGPGVDLSSLLPGESKIVAKELVKYVTNGDSLYYYNFGEDLTYRIIENNNERITDTEIDDIVKFNTANE